METQSANNRSNRRIVDFYDGKTLFLTGAAGFLGGVLLEVLLRCCPGIRCIYILLREKKGTDPHSRKEQIFKKKIFDKLREKQPDVFEKVHVVAGDVSLSNLGMNEIDALKVAQEASIIFHCAATISFLKPLKFMLIQNAIGTHNVIEFSRKLKSLEVLVYTSTAYSNSNRQDEIEECVYRLPYPAQRYIDELKNGDDESLQKLVSQCLSKWPNYYTFSKFVAENILADNASDLPVVIVRPSIITSNWKGIIKGYMDEGSGLVGLGLGIGKGFIRVIRVDGDKNVDHVPVDVAANTHIVAAWSIGTNRARSPLVLNCTAGELSRCSWREYTRSLLEMSWKHPLPKSYQYPSVTMCKSKVYYSLLSIFEHYIPAYSIDGLLWLSGRKPKLVRLYRFFEKACKATEPFAMNEWLFRSDNFRALTEKMDSEDNETFYLNLDGYSVHELTKDLPYGAPFYQWNIDQKQISERVRTTYIRYLLTSFLKWAVFISMIMLLFLVSAQIFQGYLS